MAEIGTLYGIGVGPGDPDLVTVKGAKLLASCKHVFVPKARTAADSVALTIAGKHLGKNAQVHELVFPMTADREELARKWDESARQVAAVLQAGDDACFITLGDALLYSTYIYLVRALRQRLPEARIVTVPGITAFSAAAAITDFPVGEAKEPVTIVPTADDLADVRRAIGMGGTVVLMKIGKRLPEILEVLESEGVIEQSVLVSHACMPEERIETDLRKLWAEGPEAGYLSIILVDAAKEKA